ncbi:putative peptide transporter ptr2 [Penicillium odoratum]|uniref:putative peptide transporter ptr2 n=1 Tax=Penicillium odoratum TaxID=1167516 RepID=UPI0025483083|nr:putative peptide transporter ptr2 [Penicillium odoratum]KAJ5768769.1 putative peptide transporter ptr2 [Penicillium odoratum]
MDRLDYPALRSCSMITAKLTQYYIYKDGPCGKYANYCLEKDGIHTNISVGVQTEPYVLGGLSEIFASVASLEYAYTKARNMRSLIQAVSLFMHAFSAALGQALVALSDDPLLV